ncbi:hypothetical protein BU15DRAFT_74771 [Melanogaster broomeanus]|nr:hypothetical protein BU15DRAFT_74771 [Melanogaster broomeanus]
MPRASKRSKSSATKHPEAQPSTSADAINPKLSGDSDSSQPVLVFKAGPSLEQIPDDVLLEILSHLPTVTIEHVLWAHCRQPPVVPSEMLTRTSTTRALSQTCRLLRSRCLAMAWRRIEICGAGPTHRVSFYSVVGKALRASTSVLTGCPHLRPLIQTVTVVFTRYRTAELLPAFAECLTSLPNLTLIQVVHAHSQMTTALKNAFEGKRFPSVRKLVLPSCAHEVLRCCPNVEEVTCNEGDGSTIIGAIIKGNCKKVQVLIGINAPLKRLVKFLPNLRHVSVEDRSHLMVIDSLSCFPLLTTIEIIISSGFSKEEAITAATKVLKANKSEENKFIRLTNRVHFRKDNERLSIETVKVQADEK